MLMSTLGDAHMAGRVRMQEAIIARIAALNGGDLERAEAWFRSEPLGELGGQTAAFYLEAGEAKRLERYIDNLSAGATG